MSALAAIASIIGLGCAPAEAAGLNVVVTSKPIHSLTAAIMEGTGAPVLLIDGAASLHTFTLKPSGAKAINTADVFIRVSEQIEPFTAKISASLPKSVTVVTLADTAGLTLLDVRRGSTFEAHAHGKGAGPKHKGHAGHDHAGHENNDDGDHDGPGAKDGHIWLDPENAKLMGDRIAAVLGEKAPADAATFIANAAALRRRIDDLSAAIAAETKPVAGVPFVVFHDAYQYFENRFGLAASGAVTVSPDVQPSVKRLSALRQRIKSSGAVCVFAEPLYKPNLVAAVTEGTSARSGTLDPEGAALDAGPGLYFKLMRGLSANLTACLKPAV